MNKTKTLGINAGHDSSISILDTDGSIIFAVGEERFNRKKSFTGWPYKALKEIEKGSYHIAIAQRESSWSRMERRYYQYIFNDGMQYFDIFNDRSLEMSLGSREIFDARPIIFDKLSSCGVEPESITYYDHHLCHAASAYFTSNFNNALVITADGAGDDRSASAHCIIDGVWTEISSTKLPHSAGHMYGWATRLLGYKVGRHEGKLTGLAAFGNINNLHQLIGRLLKFDADSNTLINPYIKNIDNPRLLSRVKKFFKNEAVHSSYDAFYAYVTHLYGKNYNPEDIAAIAQNEIEHAITDWIISLISNTGIKDIALAGGIFANVKLNQKISQIKNVNKVWVFPDMGDGGLCVGAAYLDLQKRYSISPKNLENVYLGPQYDDKKIIDACKVANLNLIKPDNLAKEVAKLLANNEIVGWFQGEMEYGPRALGHRSILLHPGKKSMNQLVNSRLNRTEFMPFAPSVLSEYCNEIFYDRNKSEHADQFMTITYKVKPEWRSKLSAVVHVDDTARPHVVYKYNNELYWSVIDEFRKITGLPAVVNTSFNMHEEPIVCSPEDAIRSFLLGAVDTLVMGNFIVKK